MRQQTNQKMPTFCYLQTPYAVDFYHKLQRNVQILNNFQRQSRCTLFLFVNHSLLCLHFRGKEGCTQKRKEDDEVSFWTESHCVTLQGPKRKRVAALSHQSLSLWKGSCLWSVPLDPTKRAKAHQDGSVSASVRQMRWPKPKASKALFKGLDKDFGDCAATVRCVSESWGDVTDD